MGHSEADRYRVVSGSEGYQVVDNHTEHLFPQVFDFKSNAQYTIDRLLDASDTREIEAIIKGRLEHG
jgi:hypothetical protein